MMRRSLIPHCVTAVALLAGCGSLSNDRYRAIDDSQISPAFVENSTTTTTRAIFVPSSTAPTTLPPTTTTTTVVPTETVVLYFVTTDNKLKAAKRQRPVGYTADAVMADLRAAPLVTDGTGLRTIVGGDVIRNVDFTTVPPTVELNSVVLFLDVDPLDNALIAGQIAATLTRLPGVGQVRFVVVGMGPGGAVGTWYPPLPDGTTAERDVTGRDYAPLFAP
jgi:hypothetical protein